MPQIARITDRHGGVCAHGLSCCPHNVVGEIIEGSPDVRVNGLATARLGDKVLHDCPHCSIGYISTASGTVMVNGVGVARIGDGVTYPGGTGTIISASTNVNAGD